MLQKEIPVIGISNVLNEFDCLWADFYSTVPFDASFQIN